MGTDHELNLPFRQKNVRPNIMRLYLPPCKPTNLYDLIRWYSRIPPVRKELRRDTYQPSKL